jgi:deoxyribodipyrimidine photo-lyase
VSDNSLLSLGGEVLPIFIFDTNILELLHVNDRRVSFIFDAVVKLKSDLQTLGLDLKIYHGKPVEILHYLASLGFEEVCASGDYDSYAKQRDVEISQFIHFRYLHDSYIFKPKEVLKEDGSPYLVFTPFYKKALQVLESRDFSKKEIANHTLYTVCYDGISRLENGNFRECDLAIETLGFQRVALKQKSLKIKLEALHVKLLTYKNERDFLTLDATSDLSVELRFGTLGVRELLRFVDGLEGSEDFIRQLIFRDFYAYLLFHFPRIENENYKYSFNGIEDKQKYEVFCSAKTGVPIIDAAVTQLITTGEMHNRARMIVASFFTKDLLLPWQWGEKFFAQHLLDYDKASNVLSWQWSAGTGVDPQPYFRVFNPYLQAKKFDKDAIYIKQYLPELLDINPKNLYDEEWLLNAHLLNYPKPIVRHKEAAKIAIESFKNLTQRREDD